jgi:hypothetical protein
MAFTAGTLFGDQVTRYERTLLQLHHHYFYLMNNLKRTIQILAFAAELPLSLELH